MIFATNQFNKMYFIFIGKKKKNTEKNSKKQKNREKNNIYIYSHPQTDCFVLSELFSVARHAGRSKSGSKPVQLYVRLCFRPLVHQADHFG